MLKLSAYTGTAAMLLAVAGCTRPSDPLPPPVPVSPQAVELSVTLYHCGLNPIIFKGKTWEAGPATLFDNTNKPAEWRGHGTITEISPTRLLYRDDSDIGVTYLPDAEVPPKGTCA